MSNLYYFSTAKDDFIIDFECHVIERVPRKIAKDTEHKQMAFDPKKHFPLFSGTIYTKKGLSSLDRNELIDDVFSAACIYLSRRKDYMLLRETVDYWYDERIKADNYYA